MDQAKENDQCVCDQTAEPDGELVRIIDLGFRARDIACSKDGEWVAITGESPDVCVYSTRETPNGLEQVAMLEVEGQTFRQVAFGGDGNLLAAQSARKGIYVWSTDGWSFTDRISTPSMRAFHDSLAFCPSGPTFACLRQQKREIQVWRCVAEAEPPETDPTHEGAMPGTSATSPGALSIWQEKLDYLQQQEAIAAEPAQKFAIRKQIEEALQKIRELGQNS